MLSRGLIDDLVLVGDQLAAEGDGAVGIDSLLNGLVEPLQDGLIPSVDTMGRIGTCGPNARIRDELLDGKDIQQPENRCLSLLSRRAAVLLALRFPWAVAAVRRHRLELDHAGDVGAGFSPDSIIGPTQSHPASLSGDCGVRL